MRYLLFLVALAGCQAGADASAEYVSSEPVAALADAVVETADLDAGPAASDAAEPSSTQPALADDRSTPTASPGTTTASRLLRRSADLRVSTEALDETLRDARAVATRYGGLVAGEDGSAYDGGDAWTTLTLRVPSDRFDAALDALAGLGTVASRSVSVDDVTGQVVDLEARLRARRAAEARYVAFLAEARSIDDMLTVQQRLDHVRADIESMEAMARSLRGQVALATIRATFVGPTAAPAPPPGPGFVARGVEAVALGWDGLLAVVLGVLPLWPLAVLGAVGVSVWRRVALRVRRDAVAG